MPINANFMKLKMMMNVRPTSGSEEGASYIYTSTSILERIFFRTLSFIWQADCVAQKNLWNKMSKALSFQVFDLFNKIFKPSSTRYVEKKLKRKQLSFCWTCYNWKFSVCMWCSGCAMKNATIVEEKWESKLICILHRSVSRWHFSACWAAIFVDLIIIKCTFSMEQFAFISHLTAINEAHSHTHFHIQWLRLSWV